MPDYCAVSMAPTSLLLEASFELTESLCLDRHTAWQHEKPGERQPLFLFNEINWINYNAIVFLKQHLKETAE